MNRPQLAKISARVAIATSIGTLVCGLLFLVFYFLRVNPEYGVWLFIGLPILFGVVTSTVLDWHEPIKFQFHIIAISLGVLISLLIILIFAVEGLICALMCAPLVLIVGMSGGGLGKCLVRAFRGRPGSIGLSLVVVLPLLAIYDSATAGKSDIRKLSTSIDINATPEKIWPYISTLDQIPEPQFWLFRAGVAHPTQIKTIQLAQGGERECVLSTGVMRERITEWLPGKRLTFAVTNTPPSMKELNPFGEVNAPHLQGYFECLEGSFELQHLSGGRTRLVGTSLYQQKFRPSTYWGWWTDLIVRQVHLSVLNEVKRLAER